MANFLDEFMKEYGPEVSRGVSANLGINKRTTNQLMPEVLPLILGGLKKQMETRGGADRVNHILNKYGKDDVLDRIEDELNVRSQESTPDPRLGGLLGESGVQAAGLMGNKFNLDSGVIQKLIPMLAPIILGALTRKRDKGGAGNDGIASLIDRDGDGQILDDVAGFLLGGSGGQSRGSNPLGNLLGSLFGGGRKRR
ncbi:MAG: DUF937 domain-containing protein [Candidatus Aminicenantes bacterium]|nr:DUF937 domain-containing protein [Candidatus Aminicenantes bacterium]